MQIDIKYLHRLIYCKKLKVYIFFKNSRYVLVINRYIHAEDKNENYIEWVKAFGSISPSNIITSFPIEKVKLKLKNKTAYFNSIRDLIKNIQP
ncbi:MAG: hypothetical protein QW511_00150 [Candidatus Methanomethylicia archaeon]